MAGEIIRKGDPTDHGGKVLEGSLTDICHGKPIAYTGHKVFCPRCKGTFPIIEGVLTTTFYGKGVAIAGMKLPAVQYSSQHNLLTQSKSVLARLHVRANRSPLTMS